MTPSQAHAPHSTAARPLMVEPGTQPARSPTPGPNRHAGTTVNMEGGRSGGTNMPVLSDDATTICAMMEPGRGYEFAELRKLAPELSADAIREVMRELWIERLVERFGDLGWRRTGRLEAAASAHPSRDAASLRVGAVTPEDLFDHKSFAAWFK